MEKIVGLKKENERVNDLIELLYPKQVTRQMVGKDNKIIRWIEKFHTPEEFIESERKFMRMVLKAQNKQRDEEFQEYIKSKCPLIEDFHEHIKRRQK